MAIPQRLAAGDPAGASRLLDGLAWVGRDSAQLRFGLAHTFVQQGRYDDARRALLRSAELTPAPEPHLALAQLAQGLGDLEEAWRQIDRAEALAPERPDVRELAAALRRELDEAARMRASPGGRP